MPKKSVDYLGLSCLTSKFCATCDSPHQNKKKILPKFFGRKNFPKEPYRKKNPRNSPWLTGTGSPLVAPAVPKRGRSCQAHELL